MYAVMYYTEGPAITAAAPIRRRLRADPMQAQDDLRCMQSRSQRIPVVIVLETNGNPNVIPKIQAGELDYCLLVQIVQSLGT